MNVPSEFVPIGEADQRLGVSEKDARFYARQLAPQDRLKRGRGPLMVRLPPLAALLGYPTISGSASDQNTAGQ
jgi:hypothetical protein